MANQKKVFVETRNGKGDIERLDVAQASKGMTLQDLLAAGKAAERASYTLACLLLAGAVPKEIQESYKEILNSNADKSAFKLASETTPAVRRKAYAAYFATKTKATGPSLQAIRKGMKMLEGDAPKAKKGPSARELFLAEWAKLPDKVKDMPELQGLYDLAIDWSPAPAE
jgi:hypothetical protein